MTDRQVSYKVQGHSPAALSEALQRRRKGRAHQARWALYSISYFQSQTLLLVNVWEAFVFEPQTPHMKVPVPS